MVPRDLKESETVPAPDLLDSAVQSGPGTGPFYLSVIMTSKGTGNGHLPQWVQSAHGTAREKSISAPSRTVKSRRIVKSGIPFHAHWI